MTPSLSFPEWFHQAILPPLSQGRVIERVLLGPDAQALHHHHKMCNQLLVVEGLPPFMHSLEEQFAGNKLGRMKCNGIAVVLKKPKLLGVHSPSPEPS